MTDPELFADLPRRIADRISSIAPGLRECGPHESRLTLDEIKAGRLVTPAIRVVLLGAQPSGPLSGPLWRFNLAIAAYILTADAKGLPRDRACSALAQAVLTLVPGQRWGSQSLGPADRVEMRALSDLATRKAGLAIRAILWTQPVAIDRYEGETGSLPSQVYLGEDEVTGLGGEP